MEAKPLSMLDSKRVDFLQKNFFENMFQKIKMERKCQITEK